MSDFITSTTDRSVKNKRENSVNVAKNYSVNLSEISPTSVQKMT